jgi:hypothetical protein
VPALLLICLSTFNPGECQPRQVNRVVGLALIYCARLGLPPECIRTVFGPPDAYATGRLDWRTNPDRYLSWEYTRYEVWV